MTENGNWVFPQYPNGPQAGSLSQMFTLMMAKMKIKMTMVKMNHQQILKCSKFGKGLNATSKYILGMFEKSSIGGTYVFLLAGTYLEWNVEKTKQTPPLRLTWQCVCVCVS